MKEWTDCRVFL